MGTRKHARLKAVMDYWCALWFWPIDKADELPNRMQFLFDVQMLLGLDVVSTKGDKKNAGQISMFDDYDLDPYAQELSSRYGKYGAVNLDQLRADFPRLKIANEVAEQQHFFHWELEFSDVFEERGGFDLVVGNPPWVLLSWKEQAVIGDVQPAFVVKDLSASETSELRADVLKDESIYRTYFEEYEAMAGHQNFLGSMQSYSILSGMKTDLYKCFLPQAWTYGSDASICGFVHPDGVFEDPNGGALRTELYMRLRKHFQFCNELRLFTGVHHSKVFSVNIYGSKQQCNFEMVGNLFTIEALYESYDPDNTNELEGIKSKDGEWSRHGHKKRIVNIKRKELNLFSTVFDDSDNWKEARLPVIHAQPLLDVLQRFADQDVNIGSMGKDVYPSIMWDETKAQREHIIKKESSFPQETFLLYLHLVFAIAWLNTWMRRIQ